MPSLAQMTSSSTPLSSASSATKAPLGAASRMVVVITSTYGTGADPLRRVARGDLHEL